MRRIAIIFCCCFTLPAFANPLAGTEKLTAEGDLAAKMVKGIDRYLTQSAVAVEKALLDPKRPVDRSRLRMILGIPKEGDLKWNAASITDPTNTPIKIAENDQYSISTISWRLANVGHGEGLLIEPKQKPVANIVFLPDADQTPEDTCGLTDKLTPDRQIGRILAEQKLRVLIPVLVNRDSKFSKSEVIQRQTTQPHREFIYRMGYEMGQHLIGQEVLTAMAARFYLNANTALPTGVMGHGEGAVIALYAAAVDVEFQQVASIGYAGPLPGLWKEPIDRNVWTVNRDFGLVGLGKLIYPRPLIVGTNDDLTKIGRIPNSGQGLGATPGNIEPIPFEAMRAQWQTLQTVYSSLGKEPPLTWFDHQQKLAALSQTIALSISQLTKTKFELTAAASPAKRLTPLPDAERRQERLVSRLINHIQHDWRASEPSRWDRFAKCDYKTLDGYEKSIEPIRQFFHQEVIGELPPATMKFNAKSRPIYDTAKWNGYEITIDVFDDVFSYGILLLPKDLKPQEKRPVVVCQHGLEGRPTDVCDPTKKTAYYNSFGAQLADRGYIVFAPQNPYIGRDDFRVLQRKANPLGLSLFSFIIRQHEQILQWLSTLPNVDPKNIGFYGLSYGGKTAMRVPAVLKQYRYSICSGDFNEWVGKNVSLLYKNSYMFTGEYEMYEYNMGHTLNYAEMAYLIAPRPFMVERGHDDGVGSDEMVSYEFAKVRYHYAKRLGIGDRTEMEYFVGGHEIHGRGTFEFIKKHSGYPQTSR